MRTPAPASVPTHHLSFVPILSISYLIDPAVKGGIAGAIVSFALMYLLYNKNFEREKRRELLEKRLEKLYSPLYSNLKSTEALLGQSTLSHAKSSKERGKGQEKAFIDQIIEQNYHLASKELQSLLARIHGVGFYKLSKEDAEKMIEVINKEYNKLRDEYFACK